MFFLLKTTVYLSVTALFILLTKKIFKNRLSAKWHLLIWGLLLVRFIIPSLPESNFSVFNGIDKISIQPEQSTYYTQETVQDTAPEYSYSSPSVTDENTEQHNSSSEKTVSSEFIVLTVYISGFVILLTYFISVYCVCIYKTSRLTPTKNIDTLKILDECRKLLKIKRKITVVDSDESPMLVGIIKPKILLPDIYSQREKRDIIIHELCHYKNMDILIIWMSVVVLSLN